MRGYGLLMVGVGLVVAGIVSACASGGDDGPTGDPTLTSLSVSTGVLTPSFDPNTTAYTTSSVTFTTTTATVTADAVESNAVVSVNGVPVDAGGSAGVNLVEGRNVLNVRVITTGGAARVYTIEMVRDTEINFVQQAYAKASNTDANDHFGYSVALDGDTLVVGAPLEQSIDGNQTNNTADDSGAVYVFVRSGGIWTQQAYIKASNTGAGDRFGWSVALDGDTLAVGAPLEDSAAVGIDGDQTSAGADDSGAAYMFVRSGVSWAQQAYIKASNTGAGDRFGWSVALDGNTLAVGALGEDSASTEIDQGQTDNSADNAGAAYVFFRSGVTWSQQASIKAFNTGAKDVFGVSVALAGDTLAVGAPGESSNATGIDGNEGSNGTPSAGAVYVFLRTGAVWDRQAYVKASNTGSTDAFGTSLALDGDTLVVGAPLEDGATTGIDGDDSNGAVDAGAVYVFFRSGADWGEQAYIKASNTGSGDRFGWRVDLSADTLVVGALAEDSAATGVDDPSGVGQPDNNAATAGAAYVFVRGGSTWSQLDYVKASNTETFDGFGGSVAVSADTIAVGAIGEDSSATGIGGDQTNNTAAFSGAVYVLQ